VNSVRSTYDFILHHPLGSRHKLRAINKWVGWQMRSRMIPGPHVVPFVGNTKLLIKRGMHGATGNIYCGLHEFDEMAFVMHFLRASDLFVDIGANIGSYSVIAGGVCRARTIAIEPVSDSAKALAANIKLNGLDGLVKIERCVVGESRGTVRMRTSLDCTNHVLADGESGDAQEFSQFSLDELLCGAQPSVLKIDVEGYEYHVLRGAQKTLSQSGLQAVIVEANGSGKRYGYSDEAVASALQAHGFGRFQYDAFTRKIGSNNAGVRAADNVLFLRDAEFVQERVATAPTVTILGEQL